MSLRYNVTFGTPGYADSQLHLVLSDLLLLQCRKEYYRETYLHVQPLPAAAQTVQTLHILPSFAKPQTLAASDGTIVLLQPEPYLHAPQDTVNHTADTALGSSKASSLPQGSTAKHRGQQINLPEPTHAPVQRSDLLIAITSAADRSSLIQASREWRKGVRTLIALDIPNPGRRWTANSEEATCAAGRKA
ncbi:hypothetical protein ABBQ32_009801 [Trebouxia sp. C0010 RCD-2024]